MRLVTQRMKLTERPYSLSRQGPFFPLVLFRIVILFWGQSELFQPNKIAFLSLAFLRMDREVSASRLAETSQYFGFFSRLHSAFTPSFRNFSKMSLRSSGLEDNSRLL